MTSNAAPPTEPPGPTVFDYLTEEQVTRLLAPINPRRVSHKDGMSHLEAYDVRAHLDRIFGFANWDGEVVESWHLFEEIEGEKKWNPDKKGYGGKPKPGWDDKRTISVGYRVRYRLVIRAPSGRELARYTEEATGDATNFPGAKRADAHDFAVKTAESQALKRCATNLGDQFGLSLYHNGSTDALVMRTLVGMPAAENKDNGAAPDANAPAVVPEVQPEHDEGVNPPADDGPTDDATVHQGPRDQKVVRTLEDWVKAIDGCRDLDCTRQLWREGAAAGVLETDADGIDIGDRIKAKAEQLRERSTRPSQKAGPVADAERQLAEAVARKAAKEQPTATQLGGETGSDGDEDPAPGPDLDVKGGRARTATLTALTEVFGGDESVRDAAVEQLAGKPIGLVGNRALSRILGEQTAGAPA
jgi:hypothetical protein